MLFMLMRIFMQLKQFPTLKNDKELTVYFENTNLH